MARNAERAAIRRALEARLSGTELRVFLAICFHVTKFDKVEGRVANSQLVELTGVDPRHVRRAVLAIASKGVIEREPGTSKAVASRYRFPVDEGADPALPSERADVAPQPEMGGQVSPFEGADPDALGGASAPASEVSSEVPPEEGEPAALRARRLLQREPFEADDVVHAAEAKYDPQTVADQIATYLANSLQFSFASDLRKRLDRDLAGTPPPAAPPQRHWQPCGSCSNGMLETDAGAIRCPTCNPARLAATA